MRVDNMLAIPEMQTCKYGKAHRRDDVMMCVGGVMMCVGDVMGVVGDVMGTCGSPAK